MGPSLDVLANVIMLLGKHACKLQVVKHCLGAKLGCHPLYRNRQVTLRLQSL